MEKIEEFVDDFERGMRESDDNSNDYDAIFIYKGWVECNVREANGRLPPAPAHVAPHDTYLTAGVKEVRPLWIQIVGNIVDERAFYGHLKWYLLKRSKQSHSRVFLSGVRNDQGISG